MSSIFFFFKKNILFHLLIFNFFSFFHFSFWVTTNLFVASSSSTLYGICFCFLSPSQEKRREKKGVESLLFVLLLQEKIKTKVYESLIFPMGLYFYFSSKEKRNFLVNS